MTNTRKQDSTRVYEINSDPCDSFYKGQSGRAIIKRLKEHIQDTKPITSKSMFALHITKTNQSYLNFDTKKYFRTSIVMVRIEEYVIHKVV